VEHNTNVSEEAARMLSGIADLPVAPGREAAIADQLTDWLTAANELSRKMSAPEHWTVLPATVFRHVDTEGVQE
jgi:hypothetical protein